MNKQLNLNDLKEITDSQEFKNTYQKMHTPWHRRYRKIRPNEICPFCNSGKKFKNCNCQKSLGYKNTPIYTVNYENN